jgi:small-conductance mechanosensitive channel
MNLESIWLSAADILHFKIFEINQTPVTPLSIVMFLLMMMAFNIFSRLINRVLVKRLLSTLNIDAGMRFTMVRINHYAIMLIGAIVSFQFVGVDLSGLAVIFGLLSVGIGFGLQNITSNFISGLILLFERPIKIGDRVTVTGHDGDVTDINIRSTTIKTLNNISIIVPNSEFISGNVINWSHDNPEIRLDVDVGVSYNSDLEKVLTTLKEIGANHAMTMQKPEPQVLLQSFGDSSWDMQLQVWIRDGKLHYLVKSDINKEIVRRFREENIEIPFPQRDLHFKSALPKN